MNKKILIFSFFSFGILIVGLLVALRLVSMSHNIAPKAKGDIVSDEIAQKQKRVDEYILARRKEQIEEEKRLAADQHPKRPLPPGAVTTPHTPEKDALLAKIKASTMQSTETLTRRVQVVKVNPIDPSTGKDLFTTLSWPSPNTMIAAYRSDVAAVTNNALKYQIVGSTITYPKFPIKRDGFQYTFQSYLQCYNSGGNPAYCHQPDLADYEVLLRELNLCQKANNNEFDEVWLIGGPWIGFNESIMSGPTSIFSNAFPVHAAGCLKDFHMMGFSVERPEEMLHDLGHRLEGTMGYVYGTSDRNSLATYWNQYIYNNPSDPNFNGCGEVHYPPNVDNTTPSSWDHYANTTPAPSNCDSWYVFPTLSSQTKPISCTEWYCQIYPDILYYFWWLGHVPHMPASAPDGKLANWWKYVADPAFYNQTPFAPPVRYRATVPAQTFSAEKRDSLGNMLHFRDSGVGIYLDAFLLPPDPEIDLSQDFTLEFDTLVDVVNSDYGATLISSSMNMYGRHSIEQPFELLMNSDGTLKIKHVKTQSVTTLPTKMSLHQWHHVALQKRESTLELFLDGHKIATENFAGERFYVDELSSLTIGNKVIFFEPTYTTTPPTQNYFAYTGYEGYLDEVRYSVGARYSGNHVVNTYPVGRDAQTKALYRFDSPADSEGYVEDFSGFQRPSKIFGTANEMVAARTATQLLVELSTLPTYASCDPSQTSGRTTRPSVATVIAQSAASLFTNTLIHLESTSLTATAPDPLSIFYLRLTTKTDGSGQSVKYLEIKSGSGQAWIGGAIGTTQILHNDRIEIDLSKVVETPGSQKTLTIPVTYNGVSTIYSARLNTSHLPINWSTFYPVKSVAGKPHGTTAYQQPCPILMPRRR